MVIFNGNCIIIHFRKTIVKPMNYVTSLPKKDRESVLYVDTINDLFFFKVLIRDTS